MDIKTIVTFYPLKMADGTFHIYKKTQVFADSELEDTLLTYDDRNDADSAAKDMQKVYDEGRKMW